MFLGQAHNTPSGLSLTFVKSTYGMFAHISAGRQCRSIAEMGFSNSLQLVLWRVDQSLSPTLVPDRQTCRTDSMAPKPPQNERLGGFQNSETGVDAVKKEEVRSWSSLHLLMTATKWKGPHPKKRYPVYSDPTIKRNFARYDQRRHTPRRVFHFNLLHDHVENLWSL